LLLLAAVLAACNADPARPTVFPTPAPPSATQTLAPTPSPLVTLAPTPSFRPMITSTPDASAQPVAPVNPINVIPPTSTPACLQARKGDTIFSIVARGGGDFGMIDAFRALNGIPPGGSIISEGSTYCIPVRTSTPTPNGYEKTLEVQRTLLPTRQAITFITHKVVQGDTTLGLELQYGVPLGEICRLNPLPDGLDCLTPRCNLDAPIGQAGCRVILSIGKVLKLPGPPPTATITPTLTGSETPTPTLGYAPPRIIAPELGQKLTGQVRLRWLPAGGILAPNQRYMVLMSEATTSGPRNFQYFTDSTSLLIPAESLPNDGDSHTIYWQVGIVQIGADGAAVLISEKSAQAMFTWTR
jgi:hypothetical protein